jgi:hypothetical protein
VDEVKCKRVNTRPGWTLEIVHPFASWLSGERAMQ